MKVESLMTTDVRICCSEDTLAQAARAMWERDCGCVPVLDDEARVVGMLTDRDICMAAWTQGLPLAEIQVATAMSKRLLTCKREDKVEDAEAQMRAHQVRRLPVIDEQGRLEGLISLADIAAEAQREMFRLQRDVEGLHVAATLAAVSRSRHAPLEPETKVELIAEKSEKALEPGRKTEALRPVPRPERTKVTLG